MKNLSDRPLLPGTAVAVYAGEGIHESFGILLEERPAQVTAACIDNHGAWLVCHREKLPPNSLRPLNLPEEAAKHTQGAACAVWMALLTTRRHISFQDPCHAPMCLECLRLILEKPLDDVPAHSLVKGALSSLISLGPEETGQAMLMQCFLRAYYDDELRHACVYTMLKLDYIFALARLINERPSMSIGLREPSNRHKMLDLCLKDGLVQPTAKRRALIQALLAQDPCLPTLHNTQEVVDGLQRWLAEHPSPPL